MAHSVLALDSAPAWARVRRAVDAAWESRRLEREAALTALLARQAITARCECTACRLDRLG